MKYKSLITSTALSLLAAVGLLAEPAIDVSGISGQEGTYAVGQQVTFEVTFTNTVDVVEAGEGVPPADAQAQNNLNTATNLTVTGFMTGTDIYGNIFEVPVSTSGGNRIPPDSSVTITGRVTIPPDGTFHNLSPVGYSIVLNYEYTNSDPGPDVVVGPNTISSDGSIFVDVPANLIVTDLVYPSGTFVGGDIIQMSVSIQNAEPVGSIEIVRPLTSDERFRTEFYLTDDPSIDSGNDFLLGFFGLAGNLTNTTGLSSMRNVEVAGTPATIDDWNRLYEPQPDDFFLDVGEEITVSFEVMIPRNFSGTFFAGAYTDSLGEITELQEDVDATFGSQGDNILVDDLTPLIRIASSNAPTTGPVSEISDGNGAMVLASDGVSDNPSVSDDGQWIAFQSFATNLDPDIPGTGNANIYLRNRETEDVILVSRSNGGDIANRDSYNPAISADGRYIAYESLATNLVSGAQGAGSQIYVYDRVLQRTERISKTASGLAGNGDSYLPSISEDGRFIAFESLATNLVPAMQAALSGTSAVQGFVHDRDVSNTGVFADDFATHLISDFAGNPADQDVVAPKLSMDGRVVAFASAATNFGVANPPFISQVWSRELGPDGVPMNEPSLVSVNATGTGGGNASSGEPAINGGPTSPYGLQIAFSSTADDLVPDDTNEVADIFVRDFSVSASPVTARVSLSNPRVAFGYIEFFGVIGPDNVPANQPSFGSTVTLNDGLNPPVTFTFGVDSAIGADTGETRDNLVDAINAAADLNIFAYAADTPSGPLNFLGKDGHNPIIQLFNTVPGEDGNQPILSSSSVIFSGGMDGGGTEIGNLEEDYELGEVFGSLQPSLDRSGRIVAFRSLVGDIDTIRDGSRFIKGAGNPTLGSPGVGEAIRSLLTGVSNVYYRDRDLSESGTLDQPNNTDTVRASLDKFGYPTSQLLNIASSGSSRNPALSGNGRFIAFASDSENTAGLRFDRTNRQPLDVNEKRDVFVFDRKIVVPTVAVEENPPFVALTNPSNGTTVSLTSPFFINAGALGYNETTGLFDTRSIASVSFFVNGVEVSTLSQAPFATQITPQGLGDLRIFALATDTRGNQTSSSAIIVSVEPLPFDTPFIEVTKPNIENGTTFSAGDTISLEADIRNTAASSQFRQNFELVRFDFYVNGVSVFSSTDAAETYSFDYEVDLVGTVTITAGAVYSGVTDAFDLFSQNIFSDTLEITVSEFDPAGSDKDFVTDIYERLLGRVPTSNESSTAVASLDGSRESRVAYLVDFLESSTLETTNVAMLIYRTMTGEWPNAEELEAALEVLLNGGNTISDANALTLDLVDEYEIRFSALNTQQGFVTQLFKNKHGGTAPSAQSVNRLFNSATGADVILTNGLTIPGYAGDLVTYATQFTLDNDISELAGPDGRPLSSLHLYGIPNDPTEDLQIALLISALLGETPTDERISDFDGMSIEEVVDAVLDDYLGSDSLPTALSAAIELGSNWYYLDWIGTFAYAGSSSNNWIYVWDLGWVYVAPSSVSSDAFLYSQELGSWLYGSSSLKDYYYHFDDQTWIFVHRDSSQGSAVYFYDANTWIQVNR